MREVEKSVMRELTEERDNGNNYKQNMNDNLIQTGQPCCCNYQPPVINITINPVINTTSETKTTTKNSPLHELGSVLSFLPNIIGK